jgi:hypothetical protein
VGHICPTGHERVKQMYHCIAADLEERCGLMLVTVSRCGSSSIAKRS